MNERKVFELYKRDVFKTCYYMLHNKQDAEDLMQEVFLKAFNHGLDGVDNIRAWLIRISINLSKNYLNKKKRLIFMANLTHLFSEGGVEEKISKQETEDEVICLINKLRPKQRSVIILRYIHELKIDEISEILSIPSGTVKSRINKGLKVMKQSIKRKNNFFEVKEGYPWK